MSLLLADTEYGLVAISLPHSGASPDRDDHEWRALAADQKGEE
jgi:hypothetical protein